ncbi:hypothetical protein B9Z55_009004 [Caenorhabditis nigoni]|uniref:Uncharacterized protein n=1 Tax=Caenorhabditis nigoni TaxID=1611254 RepID=A0A2G5UQ52_9PELO|nr:hypothetical protein B9Z55_009004 [Caenorhabditis nigoni]
MADNSEFMNLEEAVEVHKKTEVVTRDEMERYLKGNESTSTFWHDWNKKLLDAQEHKKRSEMVSHIKLLIYLILILLNKLFNYSN